MKKELDFETIKNRILNKNKDANILGIRREKRSGKTRIIVKLRCKCGIEFERELTHLTYKTSTYMCKNCAQKIAKESRKARYNEKYERMLKKYKFTLVEPIKNLFARDKVEVYTEDGFKFFWNVGEKPKKELIFQPNGINYKNFKYNLLKLAEINGYTCKDIYTTENSDNIEVVCECGEHFTCYYQRFKKGQFRCQRCSSSMSKYEKIFEEYLKSKNIEYIYQYRIASCKNIKPLPFDFLIKNQRILVEIQGEQHYSPIQFRCSSKEEAEIRFKKQKIRDEIKVNFCKEKKIPLLIISYKEILDSSYKSKVTTFIQTHTNKV